MAKAPVRTSNESASQTAGPYVHIGLTPNFAGIRNVYFEDLGKNKKPKSHSKDTDAITISGHVYDGAGDLVKDCLIEFFQADQIGNAEFTKMATKGFTGFNRVPVDLKKGSYQFHTIKPSKIPETDGNIHAPHITVWIVARGINIGLHTRIYFEDEAEANQTDHILCLVPKSRRQTLFAARIAKRKYQFDIHLQGENETVFFDV